MSQDDDPAITLDAKLHAFVQSLTADEIVVFDDLLTAWSEAGNTLHDVEGFGVAEDQQTMRNLANLFSMLSNIQQQRHDISKGIANNLRG